ncbi:MAG TPA: hypothetical protein VGK72_02640 [Chthoniobacterales bacterium]
MFPPLRPFCTAFALCLSLAAAVAQSGDDTVRVTVAMNPDGSKTLYQTDNAKQETIATEVGANGQTHRKILYKLDAAGRYESGRVFGADGKLRYKTQYQYDSAGRLQRETHLTRDDAVSSSIVYSYDAAGHQAGYAVYDGEGQLIGKTTAKKPSNQNTASRARPRQ